MESNSDKDKQWLTNQVDLVLQPMMVKIFREKPKNIVSD